MLQLRDLTRRFGELTAVDSASFDVPAGQMVFISDGLVTGPAPQLPQFDIEV